VLAVKAGRRSWQCPWGCGAGLFALQEGAPPGPGIRLFSRRLLVQANNVNQGGPSPLIGRYGTYPPITAGAEESSTACCRLAS